MSRVEALFVASFLTACGGSVDEHAAPDAAVSDSAAGDFLVITPPETTFVIDTSVSPLREASVTFSAALLRSDGQRTDVTSSTTFSIDDPTVGTLAGTLFRTTSSADRIGAATVVYAQRMGIRVGSSVAVIYARRGGPSGDPLTTDPYFVYRDSAVVDDPARPSGILAFEAHGSDHSARIVTDSGDARFLRRVEALSGGRSDRGCPMNATRDTNGDGVHETFVAPAAASRVCYLVVPNESALREASRSREPVFFRAWVEGSDAATRERRAVTFMVLPGPGP